jgi:hypothetical protein
MCALVMYRAPHESMGVVIGHVADGLRATREVTSVPVAGPPQALLRRPTPW